MANIEDLRDRSVSSGTLKSEDLIPKFLDVLKTYGKDKYDAYIKENPEVLEWKDLDDETQAWVVDELIDLLNDIAPEDCYFGANEGDGADFGFWSMSNESKKNEEVIVDLTLPEAKKIYADVHKNHWDKSKFGKVMGSCLEYEDVSELIDYLVGVYDPGIRDRLDENDELMNLCFILLDEWREEHGQTEAKKSEAAEGSDYFVIVFTSNEDAAKGAEYARNLGEDPQLPPGGKAVYVYGNDRDALKAFGKKWFDLCVDDDLGTTSTFGLNAKDESKKSEADGNKDIFTLDLTRIYADGDEVGLDDMQAAQDFYDEDEAIQAAKDLADSYKDDDDVVQVTVMAGEQEKPNGDIVGDSFDIFTASSSDSATTAKYREKAGYTKTDGLDYYAKGGKSEAKKSEARPTKQDAQIKELCKLCRNDKNVADSVFKALTKDYNTSLDPVLAGQYLMATWKSKLEELGGCNGWYDGFKKLYAAMGSDFVCSVLQDLKLGSSEIGCGACITIVDAIYDKVVKRNEAKKSASHKTKEELSIDDYAKYDMDHYAALAAGWTWDDEQECYMDKDGNEVDWDSSDAVMIDPIEFGGHTYKQVNVWGDGTVEFQDESGESLNWADFDDELVSKVYAAIGGVVNESKKSEDFDMNKAFFQAKKAITDWTKRQGHKTLEWLYTDGRKSPTSYPSGIWDFEWDTGNGMATAELKVSPYETRTNSWNDSMDFGLRVGTEDKPTFYTSVEDVLSALDTLISKTEIKMESKKSEFYQDWIAFYFCKDSQGAEYAVYPQDVHKRNGNTVVGLQSRNGYHTGYRKEYILNSLTPIPLDEVDDSAIYKQLDDGEDREIIAIDKKDAERIMNASNPLSELKKVVHEYDTFYKGEGIADVKKSESLTLKQKELKDMARFGQAEDITTISDAEAKELKKKGIETVGISRGTYGMNGALLRDNEGNKYVITARSSNLFYFV